MRFRAIPKWWVGKRLQNVRCRGDETHDILSVDKESDIKSATHIIRREIDKEKEKQRELSEEIAALNQQLNDANHGLLAASRISDQLETIQINNANLKEECELLFEFIPTSPFTSALH